MNEEGIETLEKPEEEVAADPKQNRSVLVHNKQKDGLPTKNWDHFLNRLDEAKDTILSAAHKVKSVKNG